MTKEEKEEKALKPEIIDNSKIMSENEEKRLKEIAQELNIIKTGNKDQDTNSYFRGVLNNLMNDDNISLKTEYLDVNENFAGTKLEFLAKYANMPYLKDFIKIFETKRVSLERKSRKEIIISLEKREEEMRMNQQQQAFKNMFGY